MLTIKYNNELGIYQAFTQNGELVPSFAIDITNEVCEDGKGKVVLIYAMAKIEE